MKMKIVTAAAAGLMLVGAAYADGPNPFFQAGSSGPPGPANPFPRLGTYQIDDGTAESQLGLTAGGDIAFIQAFDTIATQATIIAIQTSWGAPNSGTPSGLVGGEPFRVHLYSDDDGDKDPTNGGFTLLTSANGNVDPAAIESNVLQSVAIAPTALATGTFFVAVDIDQVAGQFPASRDEDTMSLGRAYVSGDGAPGGWDPTTMGGSVGLFELSAIGFDSVYLIRAEGIPAPGALALLGIAGVLGSRRRRV